MNDLITKDSYILLFSGENIIRDGEGLPPASEPIDGITPAESLGEAWQLLDAIGNIAFVKELAERTGCTFTIRSAAILKTGDVLAIKKRLRGTDTNGMPDGVYLYVNTGAVSPADFKRETGVSLDTYLKEDEDGRYILLTETCNLEKSLPLQRKRLATGRRELDPKPGKGLSP